jgi:DNA-binding beta-propeller fold protein YncE
LYTGTGSVIWDKTNNNIKGPFTLNMPPENEFGGMASYVSVNKLYTINTATQQINTLTINKDDLIKPAIWGSGEVLKDAISLAVDGNLYVLTKNSILIFRQGKLSSTLPLNLQDPLSASAVIQTSDVLSKIYILDRGNNRILVFTKKGQLDKYFTSKNFNNLKDFYVDEKGQTIYLLNAGELLKFTW